MQSVERVLRFSLLAILTSFSPGSLLCAQVIATAPPPSVTAADYNNRWDAYAGYAYARFNTTVGHQLNANLSGWKGQITGWLNPRVGLSANTGNYYGSVAVAPNPYGITNASMAEHLFLFGPEVRLLRDPKYTLDFHFLLGGTYGVFDKSLNGVNASPNQIGLYNNQLAFAAAAGANIDYNINQKFSVRGIIDFQPTHYGLAFQKDVAASGGIVYKWGSIRRQ